MELQSLDIDKYINWYYNLSLEIELLPITKGNADRYAIASFYLFTRHVTDSNNKRSLALSEVFNSKAKQLQKRFDEFKTYQAPEYKRAFFVPTYYAWDFIQHSRRSFTDTDIKEYQEKKLHTPLPELVFLKHTLNKLNEERPVRFLEQYTNVRPLPPGTTLMDFIYDIHTIDFTKYLHTEINKLEATKSVGTRLKWEGDKKDIAELIKALSLTVLAGTPETEIVQVFEAAFSDNKGNPLDIKKRYEVNKNELQDRKPREMFIFRMSKAMEEFLKKKYQ